MIPFQFHTERLFRETPAVHFSDIWIPGQAGLDLVHHHGPAESPPRNDQGVQQFYVHHHQRDHNRCLTGWRVFELVNLTWPIPRWFVKLTPDLGALQIDPGTYHRSVSCSDGSVLVNQPHRDLKYDETMEFIPVTVSNLRELQVGYYKITPEDVELIPNLT